MYNISWLFESNQGLWRRSAFQHTFIVIFLLLAADCGGDMSIVMECDELSVDLVELEHDDGPVVMEPAE